MDNEYSVDTKKKSFINHVFDTSEESKGEILNVMQYSLLGLVPIVLLNKLTQKIFPDPDETKSTLEISFEIIMQLLLLLVGIIFIHRVIVYIPTYSGFIYDSFGFINVILAFLVIVLSLQTKVGVKTNILYSRVVDVWNGTTGEFRNSKNSSSGASAASENRRVGGGGGGMNAGSGGGGSSFNVENGGFNTILNTDSSAPSSAGGGVSREAFYAPPQDPMPANFAGVSFGNF